MFFDVVAIELGADFVEAIRTRLQSSEVVLAIIGERWLNASDASGRRLDQPDDFVRLELCTALSLGARVIPVLLDNAQMPSADQLPEDQKPLARCNAELIRGAGFERDVQHLAEFVRTYLQNSRKVMTAPPRDPAREVNSPVKLALVKEFMKFRDHPTDDFIICEDKEMKKFVQFAKEPPDMVWLNLPFQELDTNQAVAASRLLTENYQADSVKLYDGNVDATLPFDPAFLSHITLDVFEHVFGALPKKPLKIKTGNCR